MESVVLGVNIMDTVSVRELRARLDAGDNDAKAGYWALHCVQCDRDIHAWPDSDDMHCPHCGNTLVVRPVPEPQT